MRKSQVQSQVFVYILGVIVMSLILLYGYRAVKGMMNRGEQTSLIKFKSDVKSTITTVSQDYGSVKVAEFEIPPNFRAVCFVNLNYNPTHLLSPAKINQDKFPYISDRVYDIIHHNSQKQNMFLMPQGTESDYVGNITVEAQGFQCFNVSQGKLKLKIEGFGNRARLSEP